LNLVAVIAVVTVAGEVGGLIGYRVGLRWGRELVARPGKHQAYRERALARGEQAYARWGRLAVFVTPAIVSGTAKMRYGQFAIWNFIASLGFALLTVAGAYGIGELVSGHHATKDVLILVLGVGVGVLLYFVSRHYHAKWEARRPSPTPPDAGAA
jgi:membrane protein DedA with SNARE-associated domain